MRNGPLPGTARLTAIKRIRLWTLATTSMIAAHIMAASLTLATTQSTPKSNRLTKPATQSATISNKAGKADRMPLARQLRAAPTPPNAETGIITGTITAPATQTPSTPTPAAYPPGEIQWSRGKTSAATPAPATSEIQWSRGKQSAAPANGRTVNITAPLRDGGFFLGDLEARVSPNDEVSVSIKQLAKITAPILRTDALEALRRVSSAPDGYVSLATLKNAGFDLQFDANKVEMQFTPTIEQRATGRLSVSDMRADVRSANLSPPAAIAAYLNMRAGADYTTTTLYNDDGTADARIGFDGAARWKDVVFESAATFDMIGGFTRGASRLVYDMPDETLRFSAGDISPIKSTFQGGGELLGLSIEKSYQKLQPSASIRPTGSQSFRIERPSSVEVVINGHVAQRLQLRPGDYDMSNLPLAAGANDIELVIEDDLGHKRTLNLSLFSGGSLLAPGIAEWAFNAGFVSHVNNGEKDYRNLYSGVEYDFDAPVVSGFYERGLTQDITGSIHLQADRETVTGGSGASLQTPIGFWTMDGAVSQSQRSGGGVAGKVNYDLSNIKSNDGIHRSFRASAEYRSEKFTLINSMEPQNDTMAILSAAYSQELPWDLFGSVSGGYMLGRGPAADKYGVNLSLSRNFGRTLSAFDSHIASTMHPTSTLPTTPVTASRKSPTIARKATALAHGALKPISVASQPPAKTAMAAAVETGMATIAMTTPSMAR
jgi:hypothetical protein